MRISFLLQGVLLGDEGHVGVLVLKDISAQTFHSLERNADNGSSWAAVVIAVLLLYMLIPCFGSLLQSVHIAVGHGERAVEPFDPRFDCSLLPVYLELQAMWA
ncbi:unnamed protein product [Bursaphelenchus xylophilus]|uniref:(pine wood nematode) hypothetical protein n=1 Tax=Bursaphelenchus xylophilus TaxID=6326 RepID=A0A1I7SRP2_BURXY|nr:unnamed protein product [Bursaphelenchus xylophilus]CAG9102047.1 unnamed protein product [Bursaphelenchus xylophilus]